MTYALLVWLILGALSSAVSSVRSKQSAESAGFLIHAGVTAVFAVYVVAVMM